MNFIFVPVPDAHQVHRVIEGGPQGYLHSTTQCHIVFQETSTDLRGFTALTTSRNNLDLCPGGDGTSVLKTAHCKHNPRNCPR